MKSQADIDDALKYKKEKMQAGLSNMNLIYDKLKDITDIGTSFNEWGEVSIVTRDKTPSEINNLKSIIDERLKCFGSKLRENAPSILGSIISPSATFSVHLPVLSCWLYLINNDVQGCKVEEVIETNTILKSTCFSPDKK